MCVLQEPKERDRIYLLYVFGEQFEFLNNTVICWLKCPFTLQQAARWSLCTS